MPPKKPQEAAQSARRYFIVNPKGCIHEVERDHAARRLRTAGWRMATKSEVEQLNAGGNGLLSGEQRADRPLCEPWSPDPDAQIDVDEA